MDRGDLRVLPGSWADPLVYMPWADTPEDPRRQATSALRMLPSARPKTSAPRSKSLEADYHGLHTRCLRFSGWSYPHTCKTRFRWAANPCRVGLEPTGSTTKGFGFCLLQLPSSLPRLCLAQGTSLVGEHPLGLNLLGSQRPNWETPLPAWETPLPNRETPLPTWETPFPNRETPLPNRETPLPNRETPLPTWEGGVPQRALNLPAISPSFPKTPCPRISPVISWTSDPASSNRIARSRGDRATLARAWATASNSARSIFR
jgi:hypothetical protein